MNEPSKNIRDYPKAVVVAATCIVLTGIFGAVILVCVGLGALIGWLVNL